MFFTEPNPPGDAVFGPFQFRGARVVRAVLTKLQGRLRSATRLIFGGGSAGGRGSMVLLDEVADRFPQLVVRGFLDSPYYLETCSWWFQWLWLRLLYIHQSFTVIIFYLTLFCPTVVQTPGLG